MKYKVTLVCISLLSCISAQWKVDSVDDGFDPAYKIAYTNDGQKPYLKLEKYNSKVSFYLSGVYVCDDPVNVDLVFVVNGVNKLHETWGHVSKNHEKTIVFIVCLCSSIHHLLCRNARCSTNNGR